MTIYTVVSIVCMAIMLAVTVLFAVRYFTKNRQGRINYLRGYKYGKVMVIYLIALPLYWIGCAFEGQTVPEALLSAVTNSVELIVLKYNVYAVQLLFDNNIAYKIAMYSCFVLVTINALLFVISLVGQNIWHYIAVRRFKTTRKELLVLFGNNDANKSIYNSDTKRVKLIADVITSEQSTALYVNNIAYINVYDYGKFVSNLVNSCVNADKKAVAIINTGNDEANIKLCRLFIDYIDKLSQPQRDKCFGALRMFVFGDLRCQTIYEKLVSDAHGCLTFINKYQKIAVDFVDQYPFTAFMTDVQLDYDNSVVKEGVDINAILIGFGKTNQQIFLTSVANNQFVTTGKDGIELKEVKYHIFDKLKAKNNKNLNHSYYRYQNELKGVSPQDYLPLPAYPASEEYYNLDINDNSFYNKIRQIVTKSNSDANFMVIAFGTDLENIDFAHKMIAKCKEWDVGNITIFVKVRGDYVDAGLVDSFNCHLIGNQNRVVYNIDAILSDRMVNMAQSRNVVYDLEYELTQNTNNTLNQDTIDAITQSSRKNWYITKSQLERESSEYCCLSLRSKLNLMGLDYCRIDDDSQDAVTEQEYLHIYAKDDMPDREFYDRQVDGKPIVNYTLDFKQSRRKTMAIHEHYRWNSFMISKGMIPSTIQQILNETVVVNGKTKYTNGKNYALRRHGNITTFDGLVEFRQLIAKRNKCPEIYCDVIKYDYQLLDDAYWLLNKNGYKIVKKK